MILVDYAKLEMSALDDEKHPMHEKAKEYDKGIRELRRLYPEGTITLKRVGFPKFIDGVTGSGREVRDIPEPVPPMRVSLQAKYEHPQRGKELWAVCQGMPKPLVGGLWDIGGKKTIQVEDRIVINLKEESDLAFFLCYRSSQVLNGHFKIDDPKEDVRQKGEKKRQALVLETAIWQRLSDETQLRKVAQGYGIANVAKKEPDAIRFELDELLKRNDEKQKSDPSIRGTNEFLEDMKITSYMRLSAFIQDRIDAKVITWKPDGKYKVGEKTIVHVPPIETNEKFKYIVNYFASPNNDDKLQELLRDTINKEYLDTITDNKDFRWLAESLKLEGFFNKPPEQVKEMVYSDLVIA